MTTKSREAEREADWGYWRDIVFNDDGTLNAEQVRKELADFSMMMGFYASVLEHVTGGAISKQNTLPEVVCQIADEHYESIAEDAIADARSQALEEAAQAADAQPERERPMQDSGNQSDDYRTGYSEGCGDVADRVRALKDQK